VHPNVTLLEGLKEMVRTSQAGEART